MDTHIPVRRITKPAEARNTRQRRIIKATMEELGDFISAQDLHLTLAKPQGTGLSRNHLPCAAVAG